MTQQPFSRPGAIDLSGLKQPAPPSPAGAPSAGGGGRSAYTVDVTEQTFQTVLEASVTAPVVLVFYSPSRAPESTTYVGQRRSQGYANLVVGQILAALGPLLGVRGQCRKQFTVDGCSTSSRNCGEAHWRTQHHSIA